MEFDLLRCSTMTQLDQRVELVAAQRSPDGALCLPDERSHFGNVLASANALRTSASTATAAARSWRDALTIIAGPLTIEVCCCPVVGGGLPVVGRDERQSRGLGVLGWLLVAYLGIVIAHGRLVVASLGNKVTQIDPTAMLGFDLLRLRRGNASPSTRPCAKFGRSLEWSRSTVSRGGPSDFRGRGA